MHPTHRFPAAMRASSGRVAIHVAVIGVHLAAWLVCFHASPRVWRPAALWRHPPSTPLTLRLLTVVATAAPPRRPSQRPSVRHPPPPRGIVTSPKPTPLPATSPARERSAITTKADVPGYAPGGNLLRGGMSMPRPVRLPGSSTPIVEGFRMVDPRMQGVGGAVRMVQALFGVVDPHCMDVEVWRGMAPAEQLARHISSTDVERTAERYHCGPG